MATAKEIAEKHSEREKQILTAVRGIYWVKGIQAQICKEQLLIVIDKAKTLEKSVQSKKLSKQESDKTLNCLLSDAKQFYQNGFKIAKEAQLSKEVEKEYAGGLHQRYKEFIQIYKKLC